MGYFTAMGTGSFSGPSELHAVTLQKTWTLPDPAVLGSPYTCTWSTWPTWHWPPGRLLVSGRHVIRALGWKGPEVHGHSTDPWTDSPPWTHSCTVARHIFRNGSGLRVDYHALFDVPDDNSASAPGGHLFCNGNIMANISMPRLPKEIRPSDRGFLRDNDGLQNPLI